MIPVSDLQVGMVLGKSMYGLNNKLMLGAGFRITADIKAKLIERGYTYAYIMEQGTEQVIPQDIISDEVRIHAVEKISDKADEIRRHLKFRDLSRTRLYDTIRSGHLKNLNITQDINAVVTEVLSNIATVGARFLNTMMFKTKDGYLMDHSLNTTVIAVLIGKKYGFNRTELMDLAVGAFLHDFGKIVIEKMLESADTDQKHDLEGLIREHSTFGYLIVHNSHNASPIACQIINQHHEHQDGSGYPLGLTGENLPPTGTQKRKPGTIYRLAEIVTVADVYDNLSGNPCRSPQLTPTEAMKTLLEGKNVLFNSDIAATLTQIIPAFPEAAVVRIKRLVDKSLPHTIAGSEAVVARVNEENINRPVILVYKDRFGKPIHPQVIDTAKVRDVELELVL
jgi:HD-GYP domain-containing protein (c-di-GMP phosphodiesterase class II)